MLAFLNCANRSPLFWIVLILACVIMESIALYFQYVLDYGPCVLCVHIRAWILAILILAIAALVTRKCAKARTALNVLLLAASVGMLERSYLTLGIERGFVDGSCTLNAGFPAWLPLEKWLPTFFEPWEACGYTPEMLFGITMAEGLILASAGLVIVFAAMVVANLFKKDSATSNG